MMGLFWIVVFVEGAAGQLTLWSFSLTVIVFVIFGSYSRSLNNSIENLKLENIKLSHEAASAYQMGKTYKTLYDQMLAAQKARPHNGDQTSSTHSNHSNLKPWQRILEVSDKDDYDAVHSAYRKLAKKFHPDNTTTGDKKKFQEIGEAFAQAKKHFCVV